MIKKLRKIARSWLNSRGFEVVQLGYETSYPLTLRKMLETGGIQTVVDVGANIGQFAGLLRENGYKGTIISFEPLPDAWEEIHRQSKQDATWVVPSRTAVGAAPGQVDINISGNSMSSSILEMNELHASAAPESTYIGKVNTPVITLDSYFSENQSQFTSEIFLKIDTQGYEMHVLQGAEKLLKHTRLIETEVSFTRLYEGQVLFDDIVLFMKERGFILWALFPVFCDKDTGRLLQADALFYKVV
jgi:FkbM family methyltransferase